MKTAKKPPFWTAFFANKYDFADFGQPAKAGQLRARKPLPMISLELTMVMKAWLSLVRRKLRRRAA